MILELLLVPVVAYPAKATSGEQQNQKLSDLEGIYYYLFVCGDVRAEEKSHGMPYGMCDRWFDAILLRSHFWSFAFSAWCTSAYDGELLVPLKYSTILPYHLLQSLQIIACRLLVCVNDQPLQKEQGERRAIAERYSWFLFPSEDILLPGDHSNLAQQHGYQSDDHDENLGEKFRYACM